MSELFAFGDKVDGYNVRVFNERVVRAAAGILFFPALVAFMNAWLAGNFQPIRLFVIIFLIDFTIRLFINPRYAPSMILGQWMVRKQQPDYSGAPQKRFAWGIGFVLALVMAYTMVFNRMLGPINFLSCGICLILMFFETSFGICIGCKIYNMIYKNQAELCPGGVCDLPPPASNQLRWPQVAVLAAFIASLFVIAPVVYTKGTLNTDPDMMRDMISNRGMHSDNSMPSVESDKPITTDAAEVARCTVPEFAKKIGHEAQWKLHNNCK